MEKTQRTLRVKDIATWTNGSILGNGECLITGICSLDEPNASALSFLREASFIRLSEVLNTIKVGALLVKDTIREEVSNSPIPLIFVKDPFAALVVVLPQLCDAASRPMGISPKAYVDSTAVIAPDASIGAYVFIGPNAHIENSVTIHPHVTIYEGARIGMGTVIHSGATIRENVVIGSYNVIQNGAIVGANGFADIGDPSDSAKRRLSPELGTVKTGDYVDLGANTCIDRATLGSTRIGHGTKVDNLVQIGPNSVIGKSNILCGQVGIAGDCTTGNQVVMGGSVWVEKHIRIVDKVRLAARAGVTSDIRETGDYAGFPAINSKAWRKWYAFIMRSVRKASGNS